MQSKKKLLKNSKLYLILDRSVNTYKELFETVKVVVNNGVDVIQLRDKNGSAQDIINFSDKIKKILPQHVIYILNDRVDLAKYCNVDGVHLGQNDLSIEFARKMLGKNAIIGKSCQSYKHLVESEKQGVDYVGLGSIFKTLTKPDRMPMSQSLIKKVYKYSNVPVFAIGGINLNNVNVLSRFGVNRICVCRAISCAKDIKLNVQKFREIIG